MTEGQTWIRFSLKCSPSPLYPAVCVMFGDALYQLKAWQGGFSSKWLLPALIELVQRCNDVNPSTQLQLFQNQVQVASSGPEQHTTWRALFLGLTGNERLKPHVHAPGGALADCSGKYWFVTVKEIKCHSSGHHPAGSLVLLRWDCFHGLVHAGLTFRRHWGVNPPVFILHKFLWAQLVRCLSSRRSWIVPLYLKYFAFQNNVGFQITLCPISFPTWLLSLCTSLLSLASLFATSGDFQVHPICLFEVSYTCLFPSVSV